MRTVRVWLSGVAVVLLTLLGAVGAARPAQAASDSFDSWTAVFSVGEDGVVHSENTVVYRLDPSGGRHGYVFELLLREAWDDEQDVVYTISNIQVSSPDPNISTDVATQINGAGTRDAYLSIQVGSPSRTISTPTVTYTLSYDLAGAMRSTADYDEFYWDVLSDNMPPVSDFSMTVSVPGGVQNVMCSNARPGSRGDCTSARVNGDGSATYTVGSRPAGLIVTVGAMIQSGLVSDNSPHLEPRADLAQEQEQARARNLGLGTTGGAAVLGAVGGTAYVRKRRTDERFAGVAPGTIPAASTAVVGTDDRPTIPVAFAPPDIPVAVAGLLDDGAVDVRDTTAALMSLAVRGVIQLRQEAGSSGFLGIGATEGEVYGRLVNPDLPLAPHEQRLVKDVFGAGVGAEKSLSTRGKLTRAHENMRDGVRAEANQIGLYARMPDKYLSSQTGGGTVFQGFAKAFMYVVAAIWAMGVFGIGGGVLVLTEFASALVLVGPLIVLILTFVIARALTRRGQRSAVGRAFTDQITGFKEYLRTAEADQIRFEEGEDIFSKYLPWAIIFGVADRWTKVCQKLVAQGALVMQPTWYYGDPRGFNLFVLSNSWGRLDTGSMPVAPSSSGGGWSGGGSGFGGGSAFGGGGGFSGGGGGGMGGHGW